MKSLVPALFLLCALFSNSFAAEPPPVAQVFRAGVGAHEGQGIAVGPDGTIYVTGQFQGTATFGATTLTNAGSFDYFLSAYNPQGQTLWARAGGGAAADSGSDLLVDRNGDFVVAGVMGGPAQIHSTNHNGFGDKDWFLAKYSRFGPILWIRFAGGSASDQAFDIAEDGAGNYYASGRIGGVANFEFTPVGAASQTRVVLAKYTTEGWFTWAREVADTESTATAGVAADAQGNAYVTGLIRGSPSSGSFVAKYNSLGTRQWMWVSDTGATSFEEASAVDIDAAGNVYIAGRLSAGEITIGSTTLHNPGGFPMGYIAKFDPAGNPLWAAKAGARALDIDATTEGDLYVTGFYNQRGAIVGTQTLPADTSLRPFIAKFAADGAFQWLQQSDAFDSGLGRAITRTPSGSIFATGEAGAGLWGVSSYPGGVFVAELREAAGGPSLTARLVLDSLELSWPGSLTGYVLEGSTAVQGPYTEDAANITPVQGRENAFSTPLTSDVRFFRLRK